MKHTTQNDRVVVETDDGGSRWSMRPDQVEKQSKTFEQETFKGSGEKMSKGDISALRDRANEVQKQNQS